MTKLSSEKTFLGLPIRTTKKRLRVMIPKVSSLVKLSLSYLIHNLVDKTKAQKKEEKDKAAKADDPKAGADVGKIVNLMAGDADRVRNVLFLFLLFSNSTF